MPIASAIINATRNRLFEWCMSLVMFLMSVEIFLWPDTIKSSAFRWVLTFIPSSTMIAVVLFVFGFGRVLALIINGKSSVYGPRFRAVGAVVGAALWLQFDLALFMLIYERPGMPPSPGIPIWFILMVGELFSAYRAATDVRHKADR